MKIKWKITLTSFVLVTVLTVAIFLVTQMRVTSLFEEETQKELANYSNMGLTILERDYPGSWIVKDGDLYKGNVNFSDDFAFIDEFTKDTNILATLFAGDISISSNAKDEQGVRFVGTQASKEVSDRVFVEKKAYTGSTDIEGIPAQTSYVPLYDESGDIIGMWFVGVFTDVKMEGVQEILQFILLLAVIFIILGMALSYIQGSNISKGVAHSQKTLKDMESGDFSFAIEEKFLIRKDEVGDMARSSHHMKEKMRGVIESLQLEANVLKTLGEKSARSIEEIHENIQDISATTEELSASMEETSAASEEMTASADEVMNLVDTMQGKTKGGEAYSLEIRTRAETLKNQALSSEKTAKSIYEDTNQKLRESIEKTSAIKEIKQLSQAILAITSQTNLLALNASIEAARAGEAGKGFAVVAEEIRVLAENSKDAVSKINDITTNVSDAVSSVVEDAEKLLGFMDNQVIKDYGVLVTTSEQYDRDAGKVRGLMEEIGQMASDLHMAMDQIRSAINDVSRAAEEGADGSTQIAEKISGIVSETNEIVVQSGKSLESSEKIDETMGYFQA